MCLNTEQITDQRYPPTAPQKPHIKTPTHANRNTPKTLYQYMKLLILGNLELSLLKLKTLLLIPLHPLLGEVLEVANCVVTYP